MQRGGATHIPTSMKNRWRLDTSIKSPTGQSLLSNPLPTGAPQTKPTIKWSTACETDFTGRDWYVCGYTVDGMDGTGNEVNSETKKQVLDVLNYLSSANRQMFRYHDALVESVPAASRSVSQADAYGFQQASQVLTEIAASKFPDVLVTRDFGELRLQDRTIYDNAKAAKWALILRSIQSQTFEDTRQNHSQNVWLRFKPARARPNVSASNVSALLDPGEEWVRDNMLRAGELSITNLGFSGYGEQGEVPCCYKREEI